MPQSHRKSRTTSKRAPAGKPNGNRRRDDDAFDLLDRALAVDRTVNRARQLSPSSFPPDVTCQKFVYENGTCEHVYQHPALGEIGRILFERHAITGRVSGDSADPLAARRQAIFDPIIRQVAQAANVHCVEGKSFACERCGAIAATLIFAPDSTPAGGLDDYARQIQSQYPWGPAPVWIIGPPLDGKPGMDSPTEVLKVWPTREPVRRLSTAEFNPLLDRIVAEHCLNR